MNRPYSEEDLHLLAELLPSIAAQLRASLGTIHAAFERIAPAEKRQADPELDRQAAVLLQSYFRILRLAGNLTDASGLLGGEPLPLKNADLSAFIGGLCGIASPLAAELGLDFSFRAETESLITAMNRDAVQRIFYNLLSNAFKFTPRGGRVSVLCRAAGDQVLLSVRDTGRGISAEQLPLLFDRYLHGDRRDPPPYGLGMGLSLSRHLAEAQGGRLLVESAEGRGTTATLSLPRRRTTATVSDLPFDYAGGFEPALVELSDALPARVYSQDGTAQ